MKSISIKTKILVLMIGSVVSVLLASTYFTQKIIEKNSEATLQEEVFNIVREIDSEITTAQELTDLKILNEYLEDLMSIRPSVGRIDIFTFRPDGAIAPLVSKTTFAIPQTPLSRKDIEQVKNDQVVWSIERVDKINYWNMVAPIHLKEGIFGILEVKISRKGFDSLLAKQRRQSFVITIVSVLLISLLLAVFMNRLIHRPIQDLLAAMSQAKEGDLTVSIRPAAKDELGRLIESFNIMIRKIKESSESNQLLLNRIHHFNEELQEKVHLATQELQDRNGELLRANQTLYRTQRKLGHSEKLAAVGQLATTVAHEVGTPLHSVSGHLQLLLEETEAPESARRRLAIMQSQVERVIQSIQHLLDTTRFREIQAGWIDLNRLLEDLCILVSPETLSKRIDLSKKFDSGLPKIFGDYNQIQELFLNLIDNALHALFPGGSLSISTSRITPPKQVHPPLDFFSSEWVEVIIRDNGSGISPDALPIIFEPFFTTKARGEGTGLGLAICREIVHQHHGLLTVESQLNHGSQFKVQLPVNGKEGG